MFSAANCELFPNKISFIIFLSYILLFINQGVLVTYSQGSDNKYTYNISLVVLITEITKLIISCILFCKNHNVEVLCRSIFKDIPVLKLYLIPALLYCIYNNLAFINLSIFDPTTYYLLLQLRVVITGILYQIVFKKYLSQRQWLSLILLTIGCMVKQVTLGEDHEIKSYKGKHMGGFDFSINALLIIVQTICSCLAGVYNEYLLKDKGSEVNIFIQNIYMYLDSILCNLIILLIQGDLKIMFEMETFQNLLSYKVIFIIINNAAIGIITSFFLKSLNSILKTFASALELMFTAVLCYIIFGIPIYLNTILAILIVSTAIILYSRNPVANAASHVNKCEELKLNEENV